VIARSIQPVPPRSARRLLPALCALLLAASPLLPSVGAQSPSSPPVGASVSGQGAARKVMFRVWAPNARQVSVLSGSDANNLRPETMQPDPAFPGHWVLASRRARPGDAYRFEIDGLSRRDPRARAVSQEQNLGTVVDPREFRWNANAWKMPAKDDVVMYEMHLLTFAQGVPGSGSLFDRAIRRLPYLLGLGVNCIQLMPVNEFYGERSWGYNPGDVFAVESSYGGAEGFRRFVDACHANGVAVLLDVVHNHYGPQNVAAWQFDQRLPDSDGGIYFYSDPDRAQTPWGPRPDYGRPEVRSFIVDSIKMFLEEYRLDGFRWDSIHNVRYYQMGAHANPDGDRMLVEANEWMRRNRPDALRIAEDHAFDNGGVGFEAQWNSAFQSSIARLVRSPDSTRNVSGFAAELQNLDGYKWVVFAECHDSAGDLNEHTRLPAVIDPDDPDSLRARSLSFVAGGIALTVPGFPMILQGFEMHDVDAFSDATPLPWARAQKSHRGIVQATRDLIHLRRNVKGFTPGLKGTELRVTHVDNPAGVLAYSRNHANASRDRAAVVVLNLSQTPLKNYGVRFPASGDWFCHFNSGQAAYADDFDDLGPKPGNGFSLPPGQTTLPLDISRGSLLVFSKSRPPNATLARAAKADELPPPVLGGPDYYVPAPRKIEEYVEEILAPFPYVLVPLPIEK
jgi:1,4-alpha-glucan branching enzyme